jgi:rod shape determining protein RodA
VHGFKKLPESHTDFIFAVICEDFGLIGGATIFCLFLILIFSLMNLLNSTKEPFALCVILGVSIIMFYQVVISMSVVLGLMPTTGLTLPLVSYGGSSILANYMGVAIAVNAANYDVLMLSKSEFSEDG